MAKVDFYNKFNEKMLEFSKDLCDGFPTIAEFSRLRTGILLLQNVEPKTLERIFRTYVLTKYRNHLVNKDETFFLEHQEFEISSSRTDYWLGLIAELKSIWLTLNDDNKNIIWKYFQIMTVLSDKCQSS